MHVLKQLIALFVSCFAIYVYSSALNAVFARDSHSIVATAFGGHLQFLTIISMYVSEIHQILAVLSLVSGSRVLNALQSWASIISTPLEVVVALLYWPLKTFKNDLVKDKRFGVVIDPYLDLKCHLYPALFELLTVTVFAQRRWNWKICRPLILVSLVAGGYWCWFEYTFKVNGFYPYPLLAVLDTREKGVLVLSAVIVSLAKYKCVQSVQRWFI